uniref:Uncharacterized protein n=1 Tax=Glossina austeni TaxID=7395 RepID=A0A1A9VHL2_GLOAU
MRIASNFIQLQPMSSSSGYAKLGDFAQIFVALKNLQGNITKPLQSLVQPHSWNTFSASKKWILKIALKSINTLATVSAIVEELAARGQKADSKRKSERKGPCSALLALAIGHYEEYNVSHRITCSIYIHDRCSPYMNLKNIKTSTDKSTLLLSLSYFYTISPCALRMLHSHLIMRALRSTIDGGSDGLYAWVVCDNRVRDLDLSPPLYEIFRDTWCCQQVPLQHWCHGILYLHDYACDDDEREKIAYDVPKGPMSCNDALLLHYSHNSCLHNQDYICLHPIEGTTTNRQCIRNRLHGRAKRMTGIGTITTEFMLMLTGLTPAGIHVRPHYNVCARNLKSQK